MAIKIAGTTVIDDDRNITTNAGTVHGRNMATDGAKLDGIATGATDNTVANAALPKAGGTMTGTLSMSGNAINDTRLGYHTLGSTQGSSPYPYRYYRITNDLTFDDNRGYEILIDGDDNHGFVGLYHIWISSHDNSGNLDRVRMTYVSGEKRQVEVVLASDEHVWIRSTSKWGYVRIRALYANENVSAMPFATLEAEPSNAQFTEIEDFEWNGDNNTKTQEKNWHSNNDGANSGLDADLLDGQHGSYYYSPANAPDPTLTLTGDVSGSATFTNLGNASLSVTVANDSHTHDGRYYTESEADSRFVNVTGDTVTGNLHFTQNPVGTTYGNGVSTVPSRYISQQVGDNDGWRIYGEAPVSNDVKMIFEVIDDNETGDTWVFRNKKTYSPYTATEDFKVGGDGNITARGNGYVNTNQRVFADNYHPNADKWTTARTLSLSGDASGSVSWDGSANATLSVAVANDSHTHDGRYYTESEADSRFVNTSGDTMTGTLTIDTGGSSSDALVLRGTSPTLSFIDEGSQDDFYIHVNGNNFYVLRDAAGADIVGAGWDSPFPLVLEGDTNIGILFGNRMFADNYHPNADKWTTSRTLSLSGDASGSVSWDGSANATLSVTVADNSHSHNNYTPIDHFRHTGHGYYASTTTSALLTEALGDDAFDSKLTAHKTGWSYAGNGNLTDAGRLTELAGTSWLWWTDNSTDNVQGNVTALAIAPNTGGSAGKAFIYNNQGSSYAPGWREIWTSTSDGSGSGLDADLLDGVQGSSYLRSDASDTFTTLTGTTLNVTGTTTLGNGNNDVTNINDTLKVYATDSGDSHFYFGENTSGGYGSHWYWDSGNTHTWYSRHAGTDTAIMSFDTRYTNLQIHRQLDMNNNDIVGVDQIFHEGDTNTYMQFHAADQWRVVTGGTERLEVNNSQITSSEPIHAPSFHGDGSNLTGLSSGPDLVTDYTLEVSASEAITLPPNRTVIVEAVGAGGAGGSSSRDDDSSANTAATGGAGGGYVRKEFTTGGSDFVLTCTVGAGGIGVLSSDNSQTGGAGGSTTVTGTGVSLTANGGAGGNGYLSTSAAAGTASGASGGTASGGDENIQGGSTGDITIASGLRYAVGGGAAPNVGVAASSVSSTAGTIGSVSSTVGPAKGKYSFGQLSGGTGAAIYSGSSTGYAITAGTGDSGCGGGAGTALSSDSSTGYRRATGGTGGNGFVRIRVLKEA